jgi:hypothetical protein
LSFRQPTSSGTRAFSSLVPASDNLGVMPTCKACGEEVDSLVSVKVSGKSKKLCEDCADRIREEGEIAEASEAVVQNMMEFKGRR